MNKSKKIIALLIVFFILCFVSGCNSAGNSNELKPVMNQVVKPQKAEFDFFLEFSNNGVQESYLINGVVLEDYSNKYLTMDCSLEKNDQNVQQLAWYFKPNKYGMKLYQCVDNINWGMPVLSAEKTIDKVQKSLSPALSQSILKYVENAEKNKSYENGNVTFDIYSGIIDDSNVRAFFLDTLMLDFFGLKIDDPTLLRDISQLDVNFHVETAKSRLIKIEIDMSSAISQLVRRHGMRMLEGNTFEGVTISTCKINIDLSNFDSPAEIVFPLELNRLEEGT